MRNATSNLLAVFLLALPWPRIASGVEISAIVENLTEVGMSPRVTVIRLGTFKEEQAKVGKLNPGDEVRCSSKDMDVELSWGEVDTMRLRGPFRILMLTAATPGGGPWFSFAMG